MVSNLLPAVTADVISLVGRAKEAPGADILGDIERKYAKTEESRVAVSVKIKNGCKP